MINFERLQRVGSDNSYRLCVDLETQETNVVVITTDDMEVLSAIKEIFVTRSMDHIASGDFKAANENTEILSKLVDQIDKLENNCQEYDKIFPDLDMSHFSPEDLEEV